MVDNTSDSPRVQRARALHAAGLNCAQSVACAFSDIDDAPTEEELRRLMLPFGGGVGGQGMMCGALTGALAVDALIAPRDISKQQGYASARELTEAFSAPYGTCQCRELKGRCHVNCDNLIADAVRLVESRLKDS